VIPGAEQKTFSVFPVLLDGWAADYPDPQNFLSQLWTTHAPYNQSHVSVPQVDALLAQADGMSDLTARIPLYQQAEQLLVTQSVAIPLTQPSFTCALRLGVANWHVAPTTLTPLPVWQTTYLAR
jgi:ABC-type oligopeptide transport system substrate-binding subunit